MRIPICTINGNLPGDDRQTIYYDTDTDRLYTDATNDVVEIAPVCDTIFNAMDAAWALWGKEPVWGFEWVEMDADELADLLKDEEYNHD